MIDSIGAENFAKRLESSGREVPPLVNKAASMGSFYSLRDGELMRLSSNGSKSAVPRPEETISISDFKRKGSPIIRNPSASIWDMGDDILLVEYHTKMNAVDPLIIEMLKEAVRMAEEEPWKAIVIAVSYTHLTLPTKA